MDQGVSSHIILVDTFAISPAADQSYKIQYSQKTTINKDKDLGTISRPAEPLWHVHSVEVYFGGFIDVIISTLIP